MMKKVNKTLYTITQSLNKLGSLATEEHYETMNQDQRTVLLTQIKHALDVGIIVIDILIKENDEKL